MIHLVPRLKYMTLLFCINYTLYSICNIATVLRSITQQIKQYYHSLRLQPCPNFYELELELELDNDEEDEEDELKELNSREEDGDELELLLKELNSREE